MNNVVPFKDVLAYVQFCEWLDTCEDQDELLERLHHAQRQSNHWGRRAEMISDAMRERKSTMADQGRGEG